MEGSPLWRRTTTWPARAPSTSAGTISSKVIPALRSTVAPGRANSITSGVTSESAAHQVGMTEEGERPSGEQGGRSRAGPDEVHPSAIASAGCAGDEPGREVGGWSACRLHPAPDLLARAGCFHHQPRSLEQAELVQPRSQLGTGAGLEHDRAVEDGQGVLDQGGWGGGGHDGDRVRAGGERHPCGRGDGGERADPGDGDHLHLRRQAEQRRPQVVEGAVEAGIALGQVDADPALQVLEHDGGGPVEGVAAVTAYLEVELDHPPSLEVGGRCSTCPPGSALSAPRAEDHVRLPDQPGRFEGEQLGVPWPHAHPVEHRPLSGGALAHSRGTSAARTWTGFRAFQPSRSPIARARETWTWARCQPRSSRRHTSTALRVDSRVANAATSRPGTRTRRRRRAATEPSTRRATPAPPPPMKTASGDGSWDRASSASARTSSTFQLPCRARLRSRSSARSGSRSTA